jgi:hypothetical protein
MKTTRTVAIGVGLAGGALLAAWLLTGTRRQKTARLVAKGADSLRQALQKESEKQEESEPQYI